jgi:hypothetical protein
MKIPIVFSLLFLVSTHAIALDGLQILSDMGDNTWIKIPVQGSQQGPYEGHSNIVVDLDNNRVYNYGSDTHGDNTNSIWYFELSDFTWHQVYPDDLLSAYVKVTSPVLGSGEYWPATNTGHPVSSHTFDGARYIPGKNCILVLQSCPHHNIGATLGSGSQPTAWLFDCGALTWTLLKNDVAPNAAIYCMIGTAPDGQTTIASITSKTYLFDWSDSTWNEITTTGDRPATYHMAMEYDTYDEKFVALGGSANYTYKTFDAGTNVWTQVESPGEGPNMNGTNVGYDTLNKVMIAHVVDGSSTFSNPSGDAATLVRSSVTAVWDTVKKTTRGDSLPPHYGFCFKAEYDMRNNVFYYMSRRDIWAYRYKRDPMTSEEGGNRGEDPFEISVWPNPFSSGTVFKINCRLKIYNLAGQKVADFGKKEKIYWNAAGQPAGVYIARMIMGNQSVEKKLFLIR